MNTSDKAPRVRMDAEHRVLETRTASGEVTFAQPDEVTALAGELMVDTPADVLEALAARVRAREALLATRLAEPGREHVTPLFVREGLYWRELHVRTVHLEPGDTLAGLKYRSWVAHVGPRYRSLGPVPADHVFVEGQRALSDAETHRLLLLELVPE